MSRLIDSYPNYGSKRHRHDIPDVTPRQRAIYTYMLDHLLAHQRLPKVRDIGLKFGITSPNGIVCHLKALVSKGLLIFDKDDTKKVIGYYRIAGIRLVAVDENEPESV